MSRKTFYALLACLAVLEVVVLLSGQFRKDAQMANAPGAIEPRTFASPSASASALYVEPAAGFEWLYGLINKAQTSIDMTMDELVDPTFSADLVQACQRGVTVRVILDQSLEKTANTPAFHQLAAAGPNCKVVWSNTQFHATHQKTITIDDRMSVVMTFNLTSRYYADTRDMAVIDVDPADIHAIQAVFKSDLGLEPPTPPSSDNSDQPGPKSAHNLIWSPTTAEDDLVSLINDAKKNLRVENEELGAGSIVDALAAACKRGVAVQVAMTDTSANYHPNYKALEAAGCGVHIGANNNSTLYIHAKAMVADLGTPDAIGYVGSINFSVPSMTQNRELGVYVHDTNALAQIGATIDSDYAQFPAYAGTSATAAAVPPRP